MEGSKWFRRLKKECEKISQYIRIKRIKYGFYRIYWRNIYVHEVYKEMPEKGYDIDIIDPRLENRSYFEEFEDRAELTRKVKNYVEGYWDSLDTIRTRVWMLRHDKEFNHNSEIAYRQMVVK